MTIDDVVVVGAGHAGVAVVAALRTQGYDGRLTVVSDEEAFPYDRPPLSKAMFSGAPRPSLVPDAFFVEREVTLACGAGVAAIDRVAGVVEVDDGTTLPYGVLVLATGAEAAGLSVPGADLDGVHLLRSLEDAIALEKGVEDEGALVVVGGGWIGLEVASAARTAGHDVTVLERESRLLARVGSPALSGIVAAAHREQGTEIRTNADVVAVEGDDSGRVVAVRLADGSAIACGRVLVAIGARPRVGLAAAAGLECRGGIVVDDHCRTSDPAIRAVGDATRRPVVGQGDLMRLESIPSAQEQARRMVADLLDGEPPAPEVPWFWSDQAGLRIQIAGLSSAGAAVSVHEDPTGDGVAVCHVEGDVLRCVEAVGTTRLFKQGRRIIGAGTSFSPHDFGAPVATARAGDADPAETPAPVITFRAADGTEQRVEATIGCSLMEVAVSAGIDGILAECGGGCSCGTCHVRFEADDFAALPGAAPLEADMLEFVDGAGEGSRLSCQVAVTAALDGMVVQVPPAPW